MRERVSTAVRIGVGFMVLAFLATGCSKSDEATPASAASIAIPSGASKVKPMAVSLIAGGGTETKTASLTPGDTLVVILESNASTGYVWSLTTQPDPSVLASEGKQIQPPTTPIPGAAGHQVFTFSATASGTTEFTLSYAQPFGDEKPAQVDTFDVTVT